MTGFLMLWKQLQSRGFTSFETRKINQDPLQNYFGNVKSHDFWSKNRNVIGLKVFLSNCYLEN